MPAAIGLAIGELLFTIGAPLVVVNFAVFSLGSILVNLALSIGLSLVAGALSRNSTPLPTPSDGQQQIRQPLSPRVRGYGQIRVAGTVWWLDAINDVLYLGLALNHGRIAAFVDYLIDDNIVDIDGSDKVTTAPYSANNVFIHHRLGLATETKYSEILTGFGVDQARGDGVASLLATIQNPASAATFQNTYPNGQPRVRVTIKASVAWDPRDPAQIRTDESTWQWSENPVVCLLDYMRSADGYGMAWERFAPSLAQWWVVAMNVCDELVPFAAGGFAKRYRVAGQYRLTDDPAAVVDKFLTIFDGRVWPLRDGSIGVVAGKFIAPRVTIGDRNILAYSEIMFGQDPVTAIEGVRAQFMSPDHGYREHEAEPWPSGAAVLELADDRIATLDLLFCPGLSQARRLMKRAFVRAKAPWRGTIVTNLAGLRALDERFINVTISELGIADTAEVVGLRLNPGDPTTPPTVELDLIAVDASIDAWDPATEEGTSEGGIFDFVDAFSKTGTTVDVLGEAGGVVGQEAYVFASNTNGVPATPAGWRLVPGMTAAVGGLAMVCYARLLDGTETTITVNSGVAGPIIVALMTGMPNASESDLNIDVQTGIPGFQIKEAIAQPYAVFQFGAANSDFDDPSVWQLLDASKVVLTGTRTQVQRGGGVTAQFNVFVFPAASAPTQVDASQSSDHGQNGMMSFIASPGS